MSFGHALYYPHINLVNKNWLKYAVLYWDKISRIVPSTVHPADSEDVIRLRSEIGFVGTRGTRDCPYFHYFHIFTF